MKEELAKGVWDEACAREGAQPGGLLRQDEQAGLFFSYMWHRIHSDFQFVCSSMRLLTDIKTKIKHSVESSYEFDTSRALDGDTISRNARLAQALLTKMTFIYRVLRLIPSPFAAN